MAKGRIVTDANGSRWQYGTEYRVLEIDQYGDAIDSHPFDLLADARKAYNALRLEGDIVAAVLESQPIKGCIDKGYEWDGGPDGMPTTLETRGSDAAIEAGNRLHN